jgi:hypothetical protein
MWYFVKGEFVEQNIAGKSFPETKAYIEQVIHPSLLALENSMKQGKVLGGLATGERMGYFMVDLPNHEEVGKWLRGLSFWGSLKWTVVGLQSPGSAIEQDRWAFEQAQMMMTAQNR